MAVIAVIGAGNGAHALAADCKLGGAEVRMYEFTQFNNKVKGILKSRRILRIVPAKTYQTIIFQFQKSGNMFSSIPNKIKLVAFLKNIIRKPFRKTSRRNSKIHFNTH